MDVSVLRINKNNIEVVKPKLEKKLKKNRTIKQIAKDFGISRQTAANELTGLKMIVFPGKYIYLLIK